MAYVRQTIASRGIALLGGLVVGDPSNRAGNVTIKSITKGSFTVDTSSVPQSSVETGTFTLSGAVAGDLVLVQASTALNAGLTLNTLGVVTATSTVTVSFINETSAAVVQTSGLTNVYYFVDIT